MAYLFCRQVTTSYVQSIVSLHIAINPATGSSPSSRIYCSVLLLTIPGRTAKRFTRSDLFHCPHKFIRAQLNFRSRSLSLCGIKLVLNVSPWLVNGSLTLTFFTHILAVLLIRTYAFFNRNVYVLWFLICAISGVVAYQLYVDTTQMLCKFSCATVILHR